MTTHLVIGDPHAHPDHNNDRALWVGELIADIRPDKVICIGDLPDLPSLSSYDKGKANFVGRTYRRDIEAAVDFQEKMFFRVKARKKKLPETFYFEGNHDERISRALQLQPQLEGTIDFRDLRIGDYWDHCIRYEGNTPGSRSVDGIIYAHFCIAGISGKALSGLHHGDALLSKNYTSTTVGHTHLADWTTHVRADGKRIHGLVCGCYQDYRADWAGRSNDLWYRGIVVKRNVEDGNFDPQFISIEALRKAYGHLS